MDWLAEDELAEIIEMPEINEARLIESIENPFIPIAVAVLFELEIVWVIADDEELKFIPDKLIPSPLTEFSVLLVTKIF